MAEAEELVLRPADPELYAYCRALGHGKGELTMGVRDQLLGDARDVARTPQDALDEAEVGRVVVVELDETVELLLDLRAEEPPEGLRGHLALVLLADDLLHSEEERLVEGRILGELFIVLDDAENIENSTNEASAGLFRFLAPPFLFAPVGVLAQKAGEEVDLADQRRPSGRHIERHGDYSLR